MSSRKKNATPRAPISKTTVSAVLIVKDEEDVLDDCLSALGWADEIVVYDTGSTDATRDIARRYTDLVIEGYWDDDFGAARNRAIEHAASTWVFSVDADEIFEGSPRQLRRFLSHTIEPVVRINILNDSGDRNAQDVDFLGPRLLRRKQIRYRGRLHEQPELLSGAAVTSRDLPICRLVHTGYRADVVEAKGKGARNVSLAREMLAEAQATGDLAQIASARGQLARTLLGMTNDAEGLEVAEAAWQQGGMSQTTAAEVCRTANAFTEASGDIEAARVWAERWLSLGDSAEARVVAAVAAARQADVERALSLLEGIALNGTRTAGGAFSRTLVAQFEAGLLVTLDRREDAVTTLHTALDKDLADIDSAWVRSILGEEVLERLIPHLRQRLWRIWALQCARQPSADNLRLLEKMHAHHPGDVTVIACAAHLHPVMSLEQASVWSARLRSLGQLENCPLIAVAQDPGRSPRDRAVAAALAVSMFRDDRAMGPLAAALEALPPEQEPTVAAELQLVAPGLVAAG